MIKVVFTGVESSGKTTLVHSIAGYYNAPRTTEYARTFLEVSDGKYSQKDLLKILQGQLDLEAKEMKKGPKLLICDTGPLVIKVWSKFKFGKVDPKIESAVNSYSVDLYILPHPDNVPFEDGPFRENPGDRQALYYMYLDELKNQSIPFIVLQGSFEERLIQVREEIDKLILTRE